MSDQQPILFYDLVAKKGANAPYFSPATIRARLGFALKGIPIETVEVTYSDLLNTWHDKLALPEGEKATVPFVRTPDGSYLMDSWKIMQWLDEAYPTSGPSIYLPGEALPVDREGEAYKLAVAKQDAGWKEFAGVVVPVYDQVFGLFAPTFVKTFDEETQAYWTSEARMGEGRWQRVISTDKAAAVDSVQRALAQLRDLLDRRGQQFFTSKDIPGVQDFLLMGFHRLLAASSAENAKLTFGKELGGWLERIHEYFGDALAEVVARDPK